MTVGHLYILRSKKNGIYYIGSTNNKDRRLDEHNLGKNKSTKNKCPWEMVFSKEFKTLQEARKAEIKLKRLKSRKIVDKIVENQKLTVKLN